MVSFAPKSTLLVFHRHCVLCCVFSYPSALSGLTCVWSSLSSGLARSRSLARAGFSAGRGVSEAALSTVTDPGQLLNLPPRELLSLPPSLLPCVDPLSSFS